jgi:ABC-type uncharacterized transport system fused permease/ATPase subunit
MWSVLAVSLVIAQIVSVENAVLLDETTTDISHTINKVRRRDGGTVCGDCDEGVYVLMMIAMVMTAMVMVMMMVIVIVMYTPEVSTNYTM